MSSHSIRRLSLPTPFPVGPVNAYVLLGEPLTLVDPGPAFPAAREALEKGLAELGLDLGAVEAVLLTHPHVDHFGLAEEVASRSGARVYAHADAVERLAGASGRTRPAELAACAELLLRSGATPEYNEALFRQWAATERLASTVRVDESLSEGDRPVLGGVEWQVVDTPGHCRGSLCLYDEAGRRLVSGDHLLLDISTNALLEFREPRPGDRPLGRTPASPDGLVRERSLLVYIGSLRKVAALDVEKVLPGHGPEFGNPRSVVTRRLEHYERRKAEIVQVLAELGPSPAFRLARTLFPDQKEPMGQFLALSEVLGHLDLLELHGRVRCREEAETDVWEKA